MFSKYPEATTFFSPEVKPRTRRSIDDIVIHADSDIQDIAGPLAPALVPDAMGIHADGLHHLEQ